MLTPLGGILLKDAILQSLNGRSRYVNPGLTRQICGVIFLGTPHSTPAGRLPEQLKLINLAGGGLPHAEFEMEILQSIGRTFDGFERLNRRDVPWRTISFFEELPIPVRTSFGPVVGFADSRLRGGQGIGLHINHEDVLKGLGRSPILLRAVESVVRDILRSISDPAHNRTLEHEASHTMPWQQNALASILQSLFAGNGSERVCTPMSGTGSWLLNHPDFTSYLKEESGILWVSGKPGSGKSTLMKFLSRHLPGTIHGAVVSSFFFRFEDPQGRSHKTMLKSSLYQLFTTKPSVLPSEMVNTYSNKVQLLGTHGSDWEWDNSELELFLRKSLTSLDNLGLKCFLLVDGLDECAEEDSVIPFLIDMVTTPRVYVCVFSRTKPEHKGPKLRSISLEDHNAIDIQSYVASELQLHTRSDNTAITPLLQEIIDKASGVFLWAVLVARSLDLSVRQSDSPGKVSHNLDIFPRDVGGLYEMLFSRVRDEKWERQRQTRSLFLWVAFSVRPLSAPELLGVLLLGGPGGEPTCKVCSDSTREPTLYKGPDSSMYHAVGHLKELSHGLLRIERDVPDWRLSTVHFVHRSVRDFLSSFREVGGGPDDIQLELAKSCVQTFYNEARGGTDRSRNPLLAYAVHHWMDHLRLVTKRGAEWADLALQLMDKTFLDNWIRLHTLAPTAAGLVPAGKSPLFLQGKTTACHILAYYDIAVHDFGLPMGHASIVQSLLTLGADPNLHDDQYGAAPLVWASAYGRLNVVELLLSRGASTDDFGGGCLSLDAAVRHNRPKVASLLLRHGADPNQNPAADRQSVLSVAAKLGRVSLVSMFLDHGSAALGVDKKTGLTPLHHAIWGGHRRALELLLATIPSKRIGELDAAASCNTAPWVQRIFFALVSGIRCHESGGEQSPNANSGQQCEGPVSSGGSLEIEKDSINQKSNPKKRDRDEPGDDSGSDDDRGSSRPTRRRLRQFNSKKLACPFDKRSPGKYAGTCKGPGFPDTHRLIQHLVKHHFLGDGWKHCERCKHSFSREDMTAHANADVACERRLTIDFEAGFNHDQRQALKSKEMKPKMFESPSRHWEKIFRVVFPDWSSKLPVPSPYYDEDEVIYAPELIERIRGEEFRRRIENYKLLSASPTLATRGSCANLPTAATESAAMACSATVFG
ncbi:hypothetical protein OQA88_1408 [Cercophora sp. LCS_1]